MAEAPETGLQPSLRSIIMKSPWIVVDLRLVARNRFMNRPESEARMAKKAATKKKVATKPKSEPAPSKPSPEPAAPSPAPGKPNPAASKRGRPVKEPPPEKLWRVEAVSPEGLKVTLGRYVTKEEAEPEFGRLQADGFYQKIKIIESPPEVQVASE